MFEIIDAITIKVIEKKRKCYARRYAGNDCDDYKKAFLQKFCKHSDVCKCRDMYLEEKFNVDCWEKHCFGVLSKTIENQLKNNG